MCGPRSLPFVVTELVAVVVRRDDVNQQDVLGLGVHACDFYLVAGEHPPGESQGVKRRRGQRCVTLFRQVLPWPQPPPAQGEGRAGCSL